MMHTLMEPFGYEFMARSIYVCAAVSGICALLSCYLVLKGWSLIGDALSHSVLPGVVIAYNLAFPFAFGAFISGFLAAISILWVRSISQLREDTVIGLIFTSFLAAGLLINSLYPSPISMQTIIFGNIMAVSESELLQIIVISVISFLLLTVFKKNLLLVLFDEVQARTTGLNPFWCKALFFCILSASVVAALQTVGVLLVVTMVITPGATAYLLTNRFNKMMLIAVLLGAGTGAFGAWLSYFLDQTPGALIVTLQSLIFAAVFMFAPKYGWLRAKIRPQQLGSHRE